MGESGDHNRHRAILPPKLLQDIAKDTNQSNEVRQVAYQTLLQDINISSTYSMTAIMKLYPQTVIDFDIDPQQCGTIAEQLQLQKMPGTGITRYIFNGQNKEEVPGELAVYGNGRPRELRIQGQGPVTYEPSKGPDHDATTKKQHAMAVLCDQLRLIAEFFEDVFGYRIADVSDGIITATTHYGQSYCNCYWDLQAKHLVVGDPSCFIGGNFIQAPDVLAHEVMHGIISATSTLLYEGQSGALNEHLADVFGVLHNQRKVDRDLGIHRDAARMGNDWNIGADWWNRTLVNGWQGTSTNRWLLRSFSDPKAGGQPDHFSQYVPLPIDEDNDWGGVHLYSSIPNHAFYVAACHAGGLPWEGVGKIWFATMIDTRLGQSCTFARFAGFTVYHAKASYPQFETSVLAGWQAVGIQPDPVTG